MTTTTLSAASRPEQFSTKPQRQRARLPGVLLPMIGYAAVGLGLAGALLTGEYSRIAGFVRETPTVFFSALEDAVYPSAHVYTGLLFAGPAGAFLFGSLAVCMCLGLAACWTCRREQPRWSCKLFTLLAALLLPLLIVDFTIYSVFEFVTAEAMSKWLVDNPALIGQWTPVAIGIAVLLCVVCDVLLVRWAWRLRPASASRPSTGNLLDGVTLRGQAA